MKKAISMMLALCMMFTCAGAVFAADYGDKTYKNSGKEIGITLVMGESSVGIDVPAALSFEESKDSDSGNPETWFYAGGIAVKNGIDKITVKNQNADYAEYANATWYTDAEFTKEASFTSEDRYFSSIELHAKLGAKTEADVEVSPGVEDAGIKKEDISTTLPAGTTLKLDIAPAQTKTAQSVVGDMAKDNQTVKAVEGSAPVYLDLKLTGADGQPTQPGKPAEITLTIPDALQSALSGVANAVLVIHYNDDGSMKETMFANLSDGKMTFTASSFSVFAFIAVEKTAFDVTIENVKGGILNVIDANGVLLPVGKKVSVPSKAGDRTNALNIEFIPMDGAEESALLVNGISREAERYDMITLSADTVLTGVFVAATGGEQQRPERYYISITPNEYADAPFSGRLTFRHSVNGKTTDVSGATFELVNDRDKELFEISGNTLTSKAALTETSYGIEMKVTAGGKSYDSYAYIVKAGLYYVEFYRYNADQFIVWDGGNLGYVRDVAKGTAFDTLASNQANFRYSIILKDGKPQMYGYEFDKWNLYTDNENSDYPVLTSTKTVNSDLSAMAMFKGYRVNVTTLGGGGNVPPAGGGDSGSSGGGGGGSLLGGGTATTGTPQAVTTAQATTAANKAIALAKAKGATEAVVKFKNAKSISAEVIKKIMDTATKSKMSAVIWSDVVVNNKVVSRMYIDLAQMTLTEKLELGVTIGDKATEAMFAKYFTNPISVVKLAQNGTYGMPVKFAVKADLSKLNTKTLQFYSYNPKTGKYTLMTKTAYAINEDGFLFFTTSVGETIIITDRPLTQK